jgi:hypothetical protein
MVRASAAAPADLPIRASIPARRMGTMDDKSVRSFGGIIRVQARDARDRSIKLYPAGRQCAESGCTTMLSVYNSGKRCGAHNALTDLEKMAAHAAIA